MYRPTVRYSDIYRDYINNLFKATSLDRNQILRLALHVAAHSDDFKSILSNYKSSDVPLPQPEWILEHMGLWMDNTPTTVEGGKHVNAIHTRTRPTERTTGTKEKTIRTKTTRREGEIHNNSIPLKSNGGTLTWSPFG